MLTNIILLLVGLALIVFGADWLVDGSSSVARKLGVSEFVIGLTIVGFGTSCPELVVSTIGAIEGNSDISIGNVVGSNIFNTLLILGLTALLMPIGITKANKRRDIPITLLVTALLVVAGLSRTLFGLGTDGLSRFWGIAFIVLFFMYIFLSFKTDSAETEENDKEEQQKVWKSVALIVMGLGGLIFGGRLFVDSATSLARMLGVSDKFIAITILAGGTSLPELATCVVAAARKKGQLALGNILGSNVFNILLILGVAATVGPLVFSGINLVDMGVVFLSALLVLASAYVGKKDKIDRFDGIVMLLCEALYFTWLVLHL